MTLGLSPGFRRDDPVGVGRPKLATGRWLPSADGPLPPFEHSTHADKFIYEAELRTGMGAHYRYAEHLGAALRSFLQQVPEARDWVVEGTAEPE